MRMLSVIRNARPWLVCAAVLAPAAGAQSFNYPDFSSIAGLHLNPASTQFGAVLRVNSATISERSPVWYDQVVSVAGGFDTTFEFQVTDPAAGGGDGMVFLIQNDPRGTMALGNHASATT